MSSNAATMNALYAHQRHIYDLTRKFYLLGRDRLIHRLAVPPGGSVLEVGCGTGRNLIAVARRYPDARLFGLDISEEMLATARAKIAAAGLDARITVVQADATDFDAAALFGEAHFDRVFFSYSLSMIPDWRAALHQGAKAACGALHLVDFGQQEGYPRWFRRAMIAWLHSFHVTPRAALPTALGELDFDARMRSLYRGYAWSAELSR
ncbi:MAG: class I SAM-dependent methyltransferase [Sphingomonadaceae bacterium]